METERYSTSTAGPSLGIQGFTEFVGTFLFIAVVLTRGRAIPAALALAAVIYFGTNYSKTSFNPAISVSLYGKGDLNRTEFFVYIAAELLAGVAALYWYNLSQKKQEYRVSPNMSSNFSHSAW